MAGINLPLEVKLEQLNGLLDRWIDYFGPCSSLSEEEKTRLLNQALPLYDRMKTISENLLENQNNSHSPTHTTLLKQKLRKKWKTVDMFLGKPFLRLSSLNLKDTNYFN
jgi:hypothetical protein